MCDKAMGDNATCDNATCDVRLLRTGPPASRAQGRTLFCIFKKYSTFAPSLLFSLRMKTATGAQAKTKPTTETLTVTYDTRNAVAVKMMNALIDCKMVTVVYPPTPQHKSALDISLQEAEQGEVTFYNNVKDIFK
jgi:hypothetical protein